MGKYDRTNTLTPTGRFIDLFIARWFATFVSSCMRVKTEDGFFKV